jgi:hypothetical protein
VTPVGLARKIARLQEAAAITSSFEIQLFERGIWDYARERRKYSSQKEHWIGWLSEYGTAGRYNRKNKRVRSAEVVYKRIGCPPMLLWLCEASKVTRRQVHSAMRAALTAGPNYRQQCAAIRAIVPWPDVESALSKSASAEHRFSKVRKSRSSAKKALSLSSQ